MPGIVRKFSGPNGQWNYIPDNTHLVLTRNGFDHVIRIDAYGPNSEHFYKIITRAGAGDLVSDAGFWVQV
jgi:hypothetical protein